MYWSIGSADGSPLRRCRRRAEARGFTLLEVLVACAVAGILLVAVLRTVALGLDGSQRSESVTRAAILAESALDALGTVSALADGDMAEITDGPFRIDSAVERYRGPDAPAPDGQYLVLFRLSVTVSWREHSQERSVSLSTLRLGPVR